ncbi:MAG TPA: M48 family metalloprotease [Pseudomonadota bacterium]|nr:M48 family metalloprotease [Pseudomonadota bacterium]
MQAVDFDFQRYVARRKGARAAQVREGAAYAYPGDVRLLRTLDRLRPVQLALEEAGRLWKSGARAEVLGPAARALAPRFERVQQAARRCAEILHIDVPAVQIVPQPGGVLTLGTEEETYIVLSQGLLDLLSDGELLDVLGRECGRIQNGHVPFRTALHYATHNASTLVRWAVRPATLTLEAWARRADITADRAGLLCARNLEVSLSAMQKATPLLAPPTGAEADEAGEPAADAQALGRRQRALSRFASSIYYRTVIGRDSEDGESAEDCDAAVADILDDKDLREAKKP